MDIPMKGRWLIAMLALARGRPISRATLAGELWSYPDTDDLQARYNLRRCLASVRKALRLSGTELYEPSAGTLALRPDAFECDALIFDDLVGFGDIASLQLAVASYNGRVVPEWDGPWIAQERERLHSAYLAAVEEVTRHATQMGDSASAIETARKALAIDPLHEPTVRLLIEILVSARQHAEAVRAYETFAKRLRREDPLAEPDSATRSALHGGRKPARHLRDDLGRDERPSGGSFRVPRPLTPLIGRDVLLTKTCRYLRTCRLLSLIGPAGVGKTRMAIAIAESAAGSFDSAYFVALHNVSHASGIYQSIAHICEVPEEAGRPLVQSLHDFLSRRTVLLLVDNCERLVSECREIISELLHRCPNLKVLVTSRQPLGVSGEHTVAIPCLSVPHDDALHPYESCCPAVQLLAERAAAAVPEFSLSRENVGAINEITRKLDGLPLAIELAAARLRTLSPDALLEFLDDRLRLLVRSDGATLGEIVEMSYSMLTECEQRVFTYASVFEGSFTSEALQAVCSAMNVPARDALLSLVQLVEKSLITFRPQERPGIYLVLETLRQFGRNKMAVSSCERSLRQAHHAYLAQFARRAERGLRGIEHESWLARLNQANDDLLAAITFARNEGLAESAADWASGLWWYWWVEGRLETARVLLEELKSVSIERLPVAVRARLIGCLGLLNLLQGNGLEAYRYLHTALADYRLATDNLGIAFCLTGLGVLKQRTGQLHESSADLNMALEFWRAADDMIGLAYAHNMLGDTLFLTGSHEEALLSHERSLPLWRQMQHKTGIAAAKHRIGLILLTSDPTTAEQHYADSLREVHNTRYRTGIMLSLDGLACSASETGEHERAAKLYGYAEAIRMTDRSRESWPVHYVHYERCIEKSRAHLGHLIFSRFYADALSDRIENGISLGLRQL
jgi:predicted ATPase/DNA-binding SARP family transcriptional activator